MEEMSAMNEKNLLDRVAKLMEQDRKAGLDMIVDILMRYQEAAIHGKENDPEYKQNALRILEEYYKDREDYEKCGFLKTLSDRIDEANKTGSAS